MRNFFVYWKPQTVVANQSTSELGHSASNQYDKLRIGDILWIVTSEEPDDLVLVGRQRVDRIVGKFEAAQILRNSRLWDADHHVVADSPEPVVNLDLSRHAHEFRFVGGTKSLPGGFTGQHLQTMRQLDYDSVNLLERLYRQAIAELCEPRS